VTDSSAPVVIASDAIRVTVEPSVGGTIAEVRHVGTGLSVLGQVPWDRVRLPIGSFAARDEVHWLTRYGGGWPLLFPNGGDACTVDGVFHGFHGEASITPWHYEAEPRRLRLSRRFYTVPVEMERIMTVEDDCLTVTERLRMLGSRSLEVMWGQHPTFGSDLLAGPVEITSGGGQLRADETYDPPSNPLLPGAAGIWPVIAGKSGRFDLRHPVPGMAALAYLHDLDEPWIAIRRRDNAIAAQLSWDATRFPCAWLWFELGGTLEAPWHGRTSLIGLEPNSTMPASGLVNARKAGGTLLRLQPGDAFETWIRLRVFEPDGAVLRLT
jgi:hypothetical protein